MIFQNLDYGILRDIIFLFRILAIIILIYLAYQTSRKIKETNFISSFTGFTVFLSTFAIFHFFLGLLNLYPDIENESFSFWNSITVNFIFLFGMFIFILFTELDYNLHFPGKRDSKLKYPLTLISALGILLLIPLVMIATILLFIFIIIPFIISSIRFLEAYQDLEIIKKAKTTQFFYSGLALAGFSNFIYTFTYFNIIPIWILNILNSFFVAIGGILMSRAWNKLPPLTELNWIRKMEKLMVIHIESSSLLFQYTFQKLEEQVDQNLAGSAIGGIKMLLGEILASKGKIKEIDHGDKVVIFNHGTHTIGILIASERAAELKYRLDMFHLSFEKKFEEILKDWSGEISDFEKAEALVQEYFR
jgi:hypothetical protein